MADDAPLEIELKLLASSATLDQLSRHAGIKAMAQGRAVTRQLHSIYWDTPSRALSAAGLLLRTRRTGRRWVQTLKQNGANAAGLERRPEWERPIQGERPDPAQLADTPLASVLEQAEDSRLVPLFATEFRRTARMLKTAEGDEIELALDRGAIVGTAGRAPIMEAELELKRGRPVALYHLARELAGELPLRLGRESKAARGFRLGIDRLAEPLRAADVPLDPEMSAADAFAAVARGCLVQLQGNEQPLLASATEGPGDGEAVHQMRVALRRLRAAISLFGKEVRTGETEQIRDGAKWLAGELSAARDLDVLLADGIIDVNGALPDEPGLEELIEDLQAQRSEAYERAVAAVKDARFTDFLLAQGAWIEGRGYLIEDGALDRPLGAFAAELLHRRHRKLLRAANDLSTLDEEGRHKLRIRVKKQRYASEFFRSLHPGRRTEAYIESLAWLQDTLGELNDAATARRLLNQRVEELERTGSNQAGALRYAAGLVIGWHAHEAARRWRKLAEKWQDSRKLKRFWPKPEAKEDQS
jgi:triphosphatase